MKHAYWIVVLAALLMFSFCGEKKSPQEQAAEKMAAAMKQMGEQMSDVEEATEKVKSASEALHGGDVTASDRDTLIALLPEIPGWKLENARYSKTSFSGIEVSNLNADFRGADGRQIDIQLTDAATASAMLAPFKMVLGMKVENEDDTHYEKVTVHNGVPVIERFDKQDQDAEFTLILKDRYILALESEGPGSLDLLKDFIAACDFARFK